MRDSDLMSIKRLGRAVCLGEGGLLLSIHGWRHGRITFYGAITAQGYTKDSQSIDR